jgi:SAM-dependent methyltransferase
VDVLRDASERNTPASAADPAQGFHFHTGRRLTRMLGYDDAWLDGRAPRRASRRSPAREIRFSLGVLHRGENRRRCRDAAARPSIVLIAARMVCPTGNVLGVDMTPAMLARARASADRGAFSNVRFHEGLAESIPVAGGWADVLISNGVLNLFPDKFRRPPR